MSFMNEDALLKIPELFAQEEKGINATAYLKFTHPPSGWTWYASGYSRLEKIFYGLIKGSKAELGYFSLAELEEVSREGKVKIDTQFTLTPLRDLID